MEFRLLGSGVHRPHPNHHLTSLFLNIEGNKNLVNVPENTQVLLEKHGASFNLDHLFLTDVRAQNLLGLPGLLSTLTSIHDGSGDGLRDITIIAPDKEGVINRITKFLDIADQNCNIEIQTLGLSDTLEVYDGYEIIPFPTNLASHSQGYVFQEPTRKGRFDRKKAEDELGIPPGPKYGKLHEGEAVELDDGRVIEPEQVVGPNRPGRSLAITGDTKEYDRIPDEIRDIDLLFCDGGRTLQTDTGGDEKHMSAYQAGTLAGAAGIDAIIVTHIIGQLRHQPQKILKDLSKSHNGISIIGRSGMRGKIRVKETREEQRSSVYDIFSEFNGEEYSES